MPMKLSAVLSAGSDATGILSLVEAVSTRLHRRYRGQSMPILEAVCQAKLSCGPTLKGEACNAKLAWKAAISSDRDDVIR